MARPRDPRSARLRAAIAGLKLGDRDALDLAPQTAHEAITRRMVEDLAADVAEIRGRVNGVFWLIVGAVLLEVALGLGGWG